KYRQKEELAEKAYYLERYGPGLLIPEGGSGAHVFPGAQQLVVEITNQLREKPAYFQLAAGTGGTAAGCIRALISSQTNIEVYPVLKGGWMEKAIQKQLDPYSANNWTVIDGYHFGGYAKCPTDLLDFCQHFYQSTGILVEPIYTGKLFFGVLDRIKQGHYPAGSTLVTYHSGGMAFTS
ncbi:MAG: pyridoxal-phosphate dependent enzyme, partial [Bacteroidota bacterium]